jgi:chitinase
MTMEFPSQMPSWGDAVISAANATLYQMKSIWPEKSDSELKSMLGVTPMIGRNFNGKRFEIGHGHQLVQWAKDNSIGHLSFWSAGRDNGGCDNTISPTCSGLNQEEFEFTRIFSGFTKQ